MEDNGKSRGFAEQESKHNTARADVWQEHEPADYSVEEAAVAQPTFIPLLSNHSLNSNVNHSTRVAAMQRAQQTQGNRAVQRAIQRAAANNPVPVQRQGDDDDEYKLRADPWPPLISGPLGGGFGFKGTAGGGELGYSGSGGKGKLGYDWGGGLSAEGLLKNPFGSGSDLGGKLEFDPFKKEGSLTGTYGDWWGKGAAGGGGFGLGFGYGAPLLTQPGLGLPGGIGDPTKDIQEGPTGPGVIPGIFKTADEIKDYQEKSKSGFGVGVQGGYDKDLGWYGWGGIQGSF